MIRVRCLVRVSGNDRTYEVGEEMPMLERLVAHHVAVGNVELVSPALAETAPELPVLGADVVEPPPQPKRRRGGP